MIVEMDLISDTMANFACIFPIQSIDRPVVERVKSDAIRDIYWLLQGPGAMRFESMSYLLWSSSSHPVSRLAKVQDPHIHHIKVLGPGTSALHDWLKENGFKEQDMSTLVASSKAHAKTFFVVAYVGLARLYEEEIRFTRNQEWLADVEPFNAKVEKALAGFTYDREHGSLSDRLARRILLREPYEGSEISEDPLNRQYNLLTEAEYDGLVERYGIGKDILLRTFPFWSRGETFLDKWSKHNYREITFWNGSEKVVLLERDAGGTSTHGARRSDDPTYSEQEIDELRNLFREYGPLVHDRFKEVRSVLWDELREHPKTKIFDTLETALGALRGGIPIPMGISFKTPAPHIPAAMVNSPTSKYRDSLFESPGPKRGRFTAYVFSQEPLKGVDNVVRIERWTRLGIGTKAELSRYLPVYDAQVASTLSFSGSPSDLAGDVTFARMDAEEEAANSVEGLAAAAERVRNTERAARTGDVNEVKRLVTEGVDLSGVDGGRILHAAIAQMRNRETAVREIVEYLLDNGANVNAADQDGRTTPLFRVVERGSWSDHQEGNVALAELLIERGGVLQGRKRKWTGSKLLAAAAALNRTRVVTFLLENGVTPETMRWDEETALHAAANTGNTDLARLLIAHGADIRARRLVRGDSIPDHETRRVFSSAGPGREMCPMDCAAMHGHVDMVRLLFEHLPEVAKANLAPDPLYLAASAGHLEVIEYLLSQGLDINVGAESGWTALSSAAKAGHGGIVEYFLDRGADPDISAYRRGGPMCVAAEGGHLDVIQLLLAHGASVNGHKGAQSHNTPLFRAAKAGHIEIVQLLLEKGADRSISYAANAAATEGHEDVAKLIRDYAD
jgi:ankyrin repeat protein